MSDTKKVWIDPKDCGLTVVAAAERKSRGKEERLKAEAERQRCATEEAERRKKEEAAKKQVINAAPKPEILPPSKDFALAPADPKHLALPSIEAQAIALPDISHLERDIRDCAKMLDLSVPEGRLDKWFGRENHRIAVKTDRGRLLAGYISACWAILEEARKTLETAGALQRARYQLHVDRVLAIHAVAESYYKLELVRRQVLRQDAIDDAKARATIAQHEAQAREAGLRGYPPPPLPPPLPAPAPVDEVARRREDARRRRREEIDLDCDEREDRADASQEIVAQARAKCTEVYRNVNIREGEKRARIQRILDAYQLDCSILPAAVQDLLIRGYEEANNE